MDERSLDDLCTQIERIKSTQKNLQAVLENLNQEILGRLAELGVHTLTTEEGRKVTMVKSQTTEWDLTVLKDILVPMGLWDRVSILKEVLDKDALETLVDRNVVSLEQLDPAMTVKPKKTYPKIS